MKAYANEWGKMESRRRTYYCKGVLNFLTPSFFRLLCLDKSVPSSEGGRTSKWIIFCQLPTPWLAKSKKINAWENLWKLVIYFFWECPINKQDPAVLAPTQAPIQSEYRSLSTNLLVLLFNISSSLIIINKLFRPSVTRAQQIGWCTLASGGYNWNCLDCLFVRFWKLKNTKEF